MHQHAIMMALLWACTGDPGRGPDEPTAPQTERRAEAPADAPDGDRVASPRCPWALADVTIEAHDTDGGVALDFTTATGDVEALRGHVAHLARLYEVRAPRRSMRGVRRWKVPVASRPADREGLGLGRGRGRGRLPPVTAAVEDLDGGARIVLTPEDPAQLPDVRWHVHRHRDLLKTGHCPRLGVGTAPPEVSPPGADPPPAG